MRFIRKTMFLLLAATVLISCKRNSENLRYISDISNLKWNLWLDKDATWEKDSLFLPNTDIKQIPANAPTCGWDELIKGKGKTIHLPATVEEYYWGENGNSFGVSGDYVGVSWFTTEIEIPESLKGKRVILNFESVRLRAEIYVNRKLAGYDLVNGTPFDVDITNFVEYGKKNFVAVRITDPNGNFDWRDYEQFDWGNYKIIPSHGFGGITGKVKLIATDKIFIEDVYVKNKPSITDIDVQVSLNNLNQKSIKGKLIFSVYKNTNDKPVIEKQVDIASFNGENNIIQTIAFPNAKYWSPQTPNLYTLKVKLETEDGSKDVFERRFGFRWFDIRTVNGDRQFYLNNKRVVVITSISWGFWPVNGIFPTPELAKKQIQDAKELGLNMLNFHRGIGQPITLDYADELGLMYYEEPGGFSNPPHFDVGGYYDSAKTLDKMEFYYKVRREKLFRMIKRDRNHPSLVIYNYINERNINPNEHDKKDMQDAHKLDEARIMTFTSSQKFPDYIYSNPRIPIPLKMHVEPNVDSLMYFGWWDEHHAGGPGCYLDEHYKSPKDFLRYSDHKAEIIYYGEEGANGSPARLQLIKDEILKSKNRGWDGDDLLKHYNAFEHFITEKGFKKAFPTVDKLTTSLGNLTLYYQGRIIENVRISNIVDGYAVNGWEDEKMENHSGVVDIYRNIKGDPTLMSYYSQLAYVAVKIRNKVVETGTLVVIDFHIVNEIDLKGNYTLHVIAKNCKNKVFEHSYPVKVTGGNTYGELLKDSVVVKINSEGYTNVEAELIKNGKQIIKGHDEIFAVKLSKEAISTKVMVAEDSTIIRNFLSTVGLKGIKKYDGKGIPDADYLIYSTGNIPNSWSLRQQLLDWVMSGHTIIVVSYSDKWMNYLAEKEVIDCRGKKDLQNVWYGGNYFVRENPMFKGLPVNTGFNWEYQCFVRYNRYRYGFRLNNGETFVGAYSDHKHELYSAVGVIPLGRGRIIYSSLDIVSALQDGRTASAVAKKLLLNYMNYASTFIKK